MRKCVKCGEPATVKFGSDPDLAGVPACDKCKSDVQCALFLAIMEGSDFFKLLNGMESEKASKANTRI